MRKILAVVMAVVVVGGAALAGLSLQATPTVAPEPTATATVAPPAPTATATPDPAALESLKWQPFPTPTSTPTSLDEAISWTGEGSRRRVSFPIGLDGNYTVTWDVRCDYRFPSNYLAWLWITYEWSDGTPDARVVSQQSCNSDESTTPQVSLVVTYSNDSRRATGFRIEAEDYDNNLQWMQWAIVVQPSPPPTPVPTSTISWTDGKTGSGQRVLGCAGGGRYITLTRWTWRPDLEPRPEYGIGEAVRDEDGILRSTEMSEQFDATPEQALERLTEICGRAKLELY